MTNLLLNSFSSDITQTEAPNDLVDNTSPYITDMSFASPESDFRFFLSSDTTPTEAPTDLIDNAFSYITDKSFAPPEADFCFFSDTINDKEERSSELSFAPPGADYSIQ